MESKAQVSDRLVDDHIFYRQLGHRGVCLRFDVDGFGKAKVMPVIVDGYQNS